MGMSFFNKSECVSVEHIRITINYGPLQALHSVHYLQLLASSD
jgi:hypothetical protein